VGRQAPSALGGLVADLHASLATPSSVQRSPVRSVDAVEVGRWSEHAHRLLAEALETVTGPEGQRLRERREQIEKAIELRHVDDCLIMPIHGDLHVGQVLRWDGGYAINDFDGNPVLATAERAQPQPAARDVAGMMQSLDHVGRVVMRRVEDADPTRTQEWIQAAQRDFLLSYARRLAHSGHEHLLEPRLLMPFRVEQELREYLYAERHLPRWRYVPDGAVTAMFAKEQ
jgi:maltokinase